MAIQVANPKVQIKVDITAEPTTSGESTPRLSRASSGAMPTSRSFLTVADLGRGQNAAGTRRASDSACLAPNRNSHFECELQRVRAYASSELQRLHAQYRAEQARCMSLLEALSLEQWDACVEHLAGDCKSACPSEGQALSRASSADFWPLLDKSLSQVFRDFVSTPLAKEEQHSSTQSLPQPPDASSDSESAFLTPESDLEPPDAKPKVNVTVTITEAT